MGCAMDKSQIMKELLASFAAKSDAKTRDILDQLRAGDSHEEIASKMGTSVTRVDLAAAVQRLSGQKLALEPLQPIVKRSDHKI